MASEVPCVLNRQDERRLTAADPVYSSDVVDWEVNYPQIGFARVPATQDRSIAESLREATEPDLCEGCGNDDGAE